MEDIYYSIYDVQRAGWCVFKRESVMTSLFHAGAFETKQYAEDEARRMNDLMEDNS